MAMRSKSSIFMQEGLQLPSLSSPEPAPAHEMTEVMRPLAADQENSRAARKIPAETRPATSPPAPKTTPRRFPLLPKNQAKPILPPANPPNLRIFPLSPHS